MGPVSWKMAALEALGAAVLVFAWTSLTEPSWGGWTRIGCALGLALWTLGQSALRQSGRGRLARGLWLATLAGLLAVVGITYLTRGQHVLTEAEQEALVEVDQGGARRLVHAGLRFSILDPGPDFPLAGTRAVGSSAVYRAYRNRDGSQVLLVGLIKGMGDSEGSLRDFLATMKELPFGSASRQLEVTRLETSGGDRPEGRLNGWVHGTLDETRFRVRAHGFTRGPASYAVLVGVLSPLPDALSEVLDSFQLDR
jgi:hypothetical protein